MRWADHQKPREEMDSCGVLLCDKMHLVRTCIWCSPLSFYSSAMSSVKTAGDKPLLIKPLEWLPLLLPLFKQQWLHYKSLPLIHPSRSYFSQAKSIPCIANFEFTYQEGVLLLIWPSLSPSWFMHLFGKFSGDLCFGISLSLSQIKPLLIALNPFWLTKLRMRK